MITTLLTAVSGISGILPHLITMLGPAFYLILFLIIFCETGLVFAPFLPGDSILFLCGSFAASANYHLNIFILLGTLIIAANLGDNVNFWIGEKFGKHILSHPKWKKLIKPEYLKKANNFFNKYGSLAIFLGRFIPIIRTVVPFTAGLGKMEPQKFRKFNLLGGITWVSIALLSGFFLGNVPFVKDHIELLMLLIVVVSLIPVVITFIKNRIERSHRNVK